MNFRIDNQWVTDEINSDQNNGWQQHERKRVVKVFRIHSHVWLSVLYSGVVLCCVVLCCVVLCCEVWWGHWRWVWCDMMLRGVPAIYLFITNKQTSMFYIHYYVHTLFDLLHSPTLTISLTQTHTLSLYLSPSHTFSHTLHHSLSLSHFPHPHRKHLQHSEARTRLANWWRKVSPSLCVCQSTSVCVTALLWNLMKRWVLGPCINCFLILILMIKLYIRDYYDCTMIFFWFYLKLGLLSSRRCKSVLHCIVFSIALYSHPPSLSPSHPYPQPVIFHTQYPLLKVGDMVKIDLGAHVDGYIVVAAHTVIVKEIAVAGKWNKS